MTERLRHWRTISEAQVQFPAQAVIIIIIIIHTFILTSAILHGRGRTHHPITEALGKNHQVVASG